MAIPDGQPPREASDVERCPRCQTPLRIVKGRWYCPRCDQVRS